MSTCLCALCYGAVDRTCLYTTSLQDVMEEDQPQVCGTVDTNVVSRANIYLTHCISCVCTWPPW